jgi:hypothetical protein
MRRKKAYTPQSSRDPMKIASPTWLAPAMVAFFVVGLLWIVVYYIAGNDVPGMSILGWWNVVVGFVLIGVGFVLATRWR